MAEVVKRVLNQTVLFVLKIIKNVGFFLHHFIFFIHYTDVSSDNYYNTYRIGQAARFALPTGLTTITIHIELDRQLASLARPV